MGREASQSLNHVYWQVDVIVVFGCMFTWDFSKDLGGASIEVSSSFHHVAIMLILVDHDLHEARNYLIAVS